MLPAPHPLLYTCVFHDSALVAELAHAPEAGGDLPALAAALAAAAPANHQYVTHSAAGRAHALLLAPPLTLSAVSLAPQLPASHLLLFLRRLRCLPEPRMRDEMPRLALRLPFPDEEALAREAGEVAAAEAEAEEAARREGELARRTPKRERGGGAGWTWRRQLWLVVLADLVLLCVLFAAWLAVCRGFSCIGRGGDIITWSRAAKICKAKAKAKAKARHSAAAPTITSLYETSLKSEAQWSC